MVGKEKYSTNKLQLDFQHVNIFETYIFNLLLKLIDFENSVNMAIVNGRRYNSIII